VSLYQQKLTITMATHRWGGGKLAPLREKNKGQCVRIKV